MTQTTVPQAGATRALSLPQRLTGPIFSPKPTFESVSTYPLWLDVLAVTVLISTFAWIAFMSTEVGYQAFVDQMYQQQEARGPITPEIEASLNTMAPIMRWMLPLGALVGIPVIVLAISGVAYGIFGALLGGSASFKQTLAVVVHAGVVFTVAGLGVLALNFFRGTMSNSTNLGVFVQMLPEDHFLARFLGVIDLTWVWYLIVLAIGLGVLYRRKTSSIAMGFFAVYFVIALGFALYRSVLGGS